MGTVGAVGRGVFPIWVQRPVPVFARNGRRVERRRPGGVFPETFDSRKRPTASPGGTAAAARPTRGRPVTSPAGRPRPHAPRTDAVRKSPRRCRPLSRWGPGAHRPRGPIAAPFSPPPGRSTRRPPSSPPSTGTGCGGGQPGDRSRRQPRRTAATIDRIAARMDACAYASTTLINEPGKRRNPVAATRRRCAQARSRARRSSARTEVMGCFGPRPSCAGRQEKVAVLPPSRPSTSPEPGTVRRPVGRPKRRPPAAGYRPQRSGWPGGRDVGIVVRPRESERLGTAGVDRL